MGNSQKKSIMSGQVPTNIVKHVCVYMHHRVCVVLSRCLCIIDVQCLVCRQERHMGVLSFHMQLKPDRCTCLSSPASNLLPISCVTQKKKRECVTNAQVCSSPSRRIRVPVGAALCKVACAFTCCMYYSYIPSKCYATT